MLRIKLNASIKLLLVYFCLWISSKSNAQNDTLPVCFSNPSFEGSPGVGTMPAPWQQCYKIGLNPSGGDIQPGFWNISLAPLHGNTYISLYGDAESGLSYMEPASQQLCSPILAGKTYGMKMDIAISETAMFTGTKRGAFQIWGGKNSCEETELLWQDSILNHNWKTYSIVFKPKADYAFITLKPAPMPGVSYPSGAFFLVDNIVVQGPSVKIDAVDKQVCPGICTKIEAIATKVIPPSTYAWSDPALSGKGPHEVCPTITTTYSVTVTDSKQNVVSEMLTITVSPPPSVSATSAITCAGSPVTLSASGDASSFTWSNNAKTSSITISPSSTSTYTVTGTTANGCSNSATAAVLVNPLPKADAGMDASICAGQSASISANGGTSYSWGPTEGLSTNTGQTVTASPTSTTNYTVTVTDGNGCQNTDEVKVNVINKSSATVSANTTICQGKTTQLFAKGGANYMWYPAAGLSNPAIADPLASPTITTTYAVIVTTGACPADTAIVTVSVNPPPAVNFTSDIYAGCAPLTITFKDSSQVINGTIVSHSWKLGDGATATTNNPRHEYKQPGKYTVSLMIKSSTECSDTKTIKEMITVYPKPKASFSHNPTVISELESNVFFYDQSINATAWKWDFGDKKDSTGSTDQNPKHHFKDTGTYCIRLITMNAEGCADTTINCIRVQPEFTFYIPNAFTPNNDGYNDFFTGYGTSIKKFEMWLFDRWGNLMYHSTDINTPWNGKLNNDSAAQIQPIEVYAYRIQITDLNNRPHKYMGHCTLIK